MEEYESFFIWLIESSKNYHVPITRLLFPHI